MTANPRTARELIQRARALASERPDQARFAAEFERLVEKIERDFEREVAAQLLSQADATITRQCEMTERLRASREELERLVETERKLTAWLGWIAPGRPDGETVH